MSFKGYLEAMVMQYVTASNFKPQFVDKVKVDAYMRGRRWLYLATGEEILGWRQAVTQLEKQLSNN